MRGQIQSCALLFLFYFDVKKDSDERIASYALLSQCTPISSATTKDEFHIIQAVTRFENPQYFFT